MKRNKPFKSVTHLTHFRLYCRMRLRTVCTGEQISSGYKTAQVTSSDGRPPQKMSTFTQIQPIAADLLGAGLSLSINHILLAAHHGLGIDDIGLVA